MPLEPNGLIVGFPHILKAILDHATPLGLLAARSANRALKEMVDQRMPLRVVAVRLPGDDEPVENTYVPTEGIAIVPSYLPEDEMSLWIDPHLQESKETHSGQVKEWEHRRLQAAVKVLKLKPHTTSAFIPAGKCADDYEWTESLPRFNVYSDVSETEEDVADQIEAILARYESQWRYFPARPERELNVVPERWTLTLPWKRTPGSRVSCRPYVFDILSLPGGEIQSIGLCEPRYIRYGPYIDPGSKLGIPRDYVLVLPVGREALPAFVPTGIPRSMIVSVRIDPGPIKPVIIAAPTARNCLHNVTLIFTPTAPLAAGSYMAVIRVILRDIVDCLNRAALLTIVNADSIPLAWLGLEEYESTQQWMSELVTSIIKEHEEMNDFRPLVIRRKNKNARTNIDAHFFTKEKYMKKKKVSASEFAIQCGD